MSIEKIIENIDVMQKLFKAYNFENVRLFKGFAGIDEKTFCLSLSLQAGQNTGLAAEGKKQKLERELKEILGFYVNITFEDGMKKNYSTYIAKPNGSINLSEVIEKAALKEKLENYFSKDWQFAKTDPYEYHKFDKPFSTTTISENLGQPFFESPKNGLSNESVKRIEDNVGEFTSKFSKDELLMLLFQ